MSQAHTLLVFFVWICAAGLVENARAATPFVYQGKLFGAQGPVDGGGWTERIQCLPGENCWVSGQSLYIQNLLSTDDGAYTAKHPPGSSWSAVQHRHRIWLR